MTGETLAADRRHTRSPRQSLGRLGTLLAIVAVLTAAGTGDADAARLFVTDQPLEVTLRADWRAIARDRTDTARRWPAELRYREADDEESVIPVEVSTRGLSRLDRSICSFPQLFVHFDSVDRSRVDGTLFAGQELLPLVTHCRKPSWYEQYVVQEYLLYRVYGLLTEQSLRVRLAEVTYEPSTRGERITRAAFFVENYHTLAERLGGEVFEHRGFHPNDADPFQMSLLEAFQYLIGNTDFSVVLQHNVVLVRRRDGGVVAVPYDLDTAGATDAVYAVPDPRMGIDSVRERRFRGICRDDDTLELAFDRLADRRDEIESLYRSRAELDERRRERTLAYFDELYEELADPERRRALLESCRRLESGGDGG